MHPILVHFPIALVVAGFLYDVVQAVRRGQVDPRCGLWVWLAAAVGAALAVATGPEQDARGNTALLHTHQNLGDATLWLVLALAAWRLWAVWRGDRPLRRVRLLVSLLLSTAACAGVLATGYYGGEMVYEQGIGVRVHGQPVNPPVHGQRPLPRG